MATSKAGDLTSAGWQARIEGRYELAERLLLEAISAARTSESKADLIRALKALAHAYRDQDKSLRAVALYEEAVQLCRQHGDLLLLAHTVRHQGDAYQELNQREQAESCYAEALALYAGEAAVPPLDWANALRAAGINKADSGDREAARELLNDAIHRYEEIGIGEGVDECRRRLRLLDGDGHDR